MTTDDLAKREANIMDQLAKRRNIGTASYEAGEIQYLQECVYEILRHLREQAERKKIKVFKE